MVFSYIAIFFFFFLFNKEKGWYSFPELASS